MGKEGISSILKKSHDCKGAKDDFRSELLDALILQDCYRFSTGRGPVVVPKQKSYLDVPPPKRSNGRHNGLCRFCKILPKLWRPVNELHVPSEELTILPRLRPPPPLPPAIYLATKDRGNHHRYMGGILPTLSGQPHTAR